jgi:hypothetical protein
VDFIQLWCAYGALGISSVGRGWSEFVRRWVIAPRRFRNSRLVARGSSCAALAIGKRLQGLMANRCAVGEPQR